MTARPLTAVAYVEVLDRIELGEPPGEISAKLNLRPDDMALVALTTELVALRERPAAPEPPPWQSMRDAAVVAPAFGLNGTIPRAVTAVGSTTLRPPSRPRPVVERRSARSRWSLGDLAFLSAALAVTLLMSWRALDSVEPRRRMPATPHAPSLPLVVPGASPTAALLNVVTPAAQPPEAPTMTPRTTPLSPKPNGGIEDAAPIRSSPEATATGDSRGYGTTPEDGRRQSAPRSAAATDSAGYPGPHAPSATQPAYPAPPSPATPEPRITRIAPPAVPTTAPTDRPTAPATPSPRTPPPTPTVGGTRPATSTPEPPTVVPTPTSLAR
ncbi:MAG: hypothetical protein ABI780_13185 [Ardenticatenales bacterium]